MYIFVLLMSFDIGNVTWVNVNKVIIIITPKEMPTGVVYEWQTKLNEAMWKSLKRQAASRIHFPGRQLPAACKP